MRRAWSVNLSNILSAALPAWSCLPSQQTRYIAFVGGRRARRRPGMDERRCRAREPTPTLLTGPGRDCSGLVLGADSAQMPRDPAIVGGWPGRDQLEHGFVAAVGIPAVAERIVQVGSPLRGGHQARLYQREPVEESHDVGAVTRDERRVPVQILGYAEQPLGRLGMSFAGHMAKGQIAARRHRVPELPDDIPRVFLVPQAVQHTHEHDPDRLAEVEQVAYLCVA